VGWFVMHVDEPSGAVTSVEILQSTGHKILDQAAVDTFKKWRFLPHHGFKNVKTPITFSMLPNEKA
jgi:TonB family protein